MSISAIFVTMGPTLGLKSAYGFATKVTIDPDRQTGLFANPNEAGAFGSYLLVILLSGFVFFKRKGWICLVLVPMALSVVFLSYSKAAMVVAVLVLLTFVLYSLRFSQEFRGWNFLKPIVFGVASMIVLSIAFRQFFTYIGDLSYNQRTRLMNTFQLASGDINKNTTSERLEIFNHVFRKIKKRPVFGYGLGVFHRIKDLPGGNTMGAHNTHLVILGEAGVFPLIIFYLFFIMLGVIGLKHPHPPIGFLIIGICIVFFLGVAGSSHNAIDDRTSNALLGIAVALSQIKKRLNN